MKTKLRIKIMQDNAKARELRHISQEPLDNTHFF